MKYCTYNILNSNYNVNKYATLFINQNLMLIYGMHCAF